MEDGGSVLDGARHMLCSVFSEASFCDNIQGAGAQEATNNLQGRSNSIMDTARQMAQQNKM